MEAVIFPGIRPDLTVRYASLWNPENDAGWDEGDKDLPCAIVLAVPDDGQQKVIVPRHAPSTETSGRGPRDSGCAPKGLRLDE